MINKNLIKFSLATRITHWLTAILIFALIPLGIKMSEMEISVEKLNLYKTHTAIGILLLLLTIYRIYLFFKHERPIHIQTGSKWNDKLAVWIHNAFYFIIILMVMSGLAINASSGLLEVFASGDISQFPNMEDLKPVQAHGTLYLIIAIFIIMHVAGYFKHWILKKENTIRRIF